MPGFHRKTKLGDRQRKLRQRLSKSQRSNTPKKTPKYKPNSKFRNLDLARQWEREEKESRNKNLDVFKEDAYCVYLNYKEKEHNQYLSTYKSFKNQSQVISFTEFVYFEECRSILFDMGFCPEISDIIFNFLDITLPIYCYYSDKMDSPFYNSRNYFNYHIMLRIECENEIDIFNHNEYCYRQLASSLKTSRFCLDYGSDYEEDNYGSDYEE